MLYSGRAEDVVLKHGEELLSKLDKGAMQCGAAKGDFTITLHLDDVESLVLLKALD